VWLGIILPEFHFIAWIAGLVVVALSWRRVSIRRHLEIGFLVFTVLFPPATVVLLKSTLYDGVRHLTFILPPMCALAGLAVSAWLGSELPRWVKVGVLATIAVSAVDTVVEMRRLHPYQAIYFNHVAGGLRGAAPRFETDYWGCPTAKAWNG